MYQHSYEACTTSNLIYIVQRGFWYCNITTLEAHNETSLLTFHIKHIKFLHKITAFFIITCLCISSPFTCVWPFFCAALLYYAQVHMQWNVFCLCSVLKQSVSTSAVLSSHSDRTQRETSLVICRCPTQPKYQVYISYEIASNIHVLWYTFTQDMPLRQHCLNQICMYSFLCIDFAIKFTLIYLF